MPIIHYSNQHPQTLEEFYTTLIPDNIKNFSGVGIPMLGILALINETFKDTIIYGLTSHSTLVLLNEDSYRGPWLILINALPATLKEQRHEYNIEYRMTPEKSPWPIAYIKGWTTSLEELRKYILIAMTECGGWAGNEELEKLYSNIGIEK